MGAFTGMDTATRGFQSNPLKPGRYIVRIDECAFFDTQNDGEMWKNSHTVIAVEDGEQGVGELTHTFFRMKPGKQIFQSNVTGFIAGILGCNDDEVDEAASLRVVDEKAQPFAGYVVPVTAVQRVSKTKKTESGSAVTYTTYTWGRRMTNEEILVAIGPEGVERFFPNGLK